MLQIFKYLCLVVLLFLYADAAGQVLTFQKVFDNGGFQYPQRAGLAKQVMDGGYIQIGEQVIAFVSGNQDMAVTKLDSNGAFLWRKLYRKPAVVDTYGFIENPDSTLVILCPDVAGNLLKISPDGAIIWTREYPLSFKSMKAVPGGGYILVGSNKLVKVDTAGIVVWSRVFYPNCGLENVDVASDSGFIFNGRNWTDSVTKLFLGKTDRNGNTLWTKAFPIEHSLLSGDIVCTEDNEIVFGGTFQDISKTTKDAFVVRFDDTGKVIWAKSYGGAGTDWFNSGLEVEGGSFVFSGTADGYAPAGRRHILVKTNGEGDVLFSKIYSGAYVNWRSWLSQSRDGGFLLSASNDNVINLVKTDSSGLTSCDAWDINLPVTDIFLNQVPLTIIDSFTSTTSLSKTWSEWSQSIVINTVCSSLGFTEPEARNQVRLYPNPFSGNVLWIENSDNDPITDVYIIDMKGSLVQHHQMNSINQNSLNADLNTGIYLVHVNTRNHNRTTHKLVVLK